MKKIGIGLSLLLLGAPAFAAGTKYKLDESHMNVGFKVKHLVIATVHGRFNKFSGGFDFDEKTGKISDLAVKVDAESIDTNEADRDKHLRSKDFFGVEDHPTIEFTAKKVDYKGNKPRKIHGDLTMRGVTKPVTLDVDFKGTVVDPWGNKRVVFEATGELKRKDFGMTWNKTLDKGGVAVSDEVKLIIDGEAMPVSKD